jgi:hypothetical protein
MPRSRSTAIQSERTRRSSPCLDPRPNSKVVGQGGPAGRRGRNDHKRPPARDLVGALVPNLDMIVLLGNRGKPFERMPKEQR